MKGISIAHQNTRKMNFRKYAEKADIIVNEVAEELGCTGDKKLATRILKAVLHTLRERLTIQESFQLMSQLPMLIKALYVENWKYREKPRRIKSVGAFLKAVIHEDAPMGHHDIQSVKDGENAIRAVFKVLRNHVSEGEINGILQILPKDLHELWGEPHLV
ncbi:MAG: DUF2267 domain-containing protein [Cyclobacteriaceae bacterium]|nr:DUF2267 domain-containing protein [Cyclobacteriaceae bacterium]